MMGMKLQHTTVNLINHRLLMSISNIPRSDQKHTYKQRFIKLLVVEFFHKGGLTNLFHVITCLINLAL